MHRKEVEEIILGMADLVIENRELRYELEEMREYKNKYQKLLDDSLKAANQNSAALLGAIMAGAFDNK